MTSLATTQTTINELHDILPDTYSIWRMVERKDGTAAVLLQYEPAYDCYEHFTVGWFADLHEAVEQTIIYLDLFGENTVNVLKQTKKLFPHLKGVMLKDKPVCMTLNGYVNEIMPDGNADKSRLEIGFKETSKTAVVNSNQILKIVDMYGEESDDWKGQKVVLYAEEGTAFGKSYCAIRVANMNDKDEKRAFGQYLKANNKKAGDPEPIQSGQLFPDEAVEELPEYA